MKLDVKKLPMSLEEFMKLPGRSRHEYLTNIVSEKIKSEGFTAIQREKELGLNRERRIDLYAEKDGRRIGVEIWTDRALYEKIQDYEKYCDEGFLDDVILVVPGKNIKLWCIEVPYKYLK